MSKTRLTKRWVVLPKQSDDLSEQLLLNRKIDPKERENFLAPDYSRGLHNPFRMKNMDRAVDRVIKAIKARETIALYGDYDTDGTPAVALLHDFLRKLDQKVLHYIPTREEGYGLHNEAIDSLKKDGASLMITVDTGIRNLTEISYAKSIGIDTIVCDHHLTPAELPEAINLNPKQVGDNYPFKELCGTGVAFKLLQAIATRASEYTKQFSADDLEKFLRWEMDLVGLATIVDMVPLVGENRVLAKYGLIALQKTRRLGLQALYRAAGIEPTTIDAYAASFLIGPRLNAAGRMDHANQSFYLLTTTDPEEAKKLASEVNELNRKRQQLLDKVLKEARTKVEKERLHERKVIVLDGAGWPHGIVGLVAGKLVEQFARPTIVFERGKIRSKGSARSIDAFHIVEALDHCQDVLLKHGGHAKAAGLTIETKHLSTLYDKLLEIAESKLKDGDLVPTITVDDELSIEGVDEKLLTLLEQFEPHGLGNSRPLFLAKDAIVQSIRAVGGDGRHLKMTLSGKDAIAFDMGDLSHEIMVGDVVDLVYSAERDTWEGRSKIQLKVMDLKKSGLE